MPLSFIHRFEPATRPEAAPVLLLHGTGGDENDLLPLGRTISPGAALLAVRGKVLEHGMPRFFRRLEEGVFDEEDVVRRAHELADFVDAARNEFGIGAPLALGFSNGANIAAAMLFLRPASLAGGILLRAMVPLADPPKSDLSGKAALILSGRHDPIASLTEGERLAAMLEARGARAERHILPAGHQLAQADITLTRKWLVSAQTAAAPIASLP